MLSEVKCHTFQAYPSNMFRDNTHCESSVLYLPTGFSVSAYVCVSLLASSLFPFNILSFGDRILNCLQKVSYMDVVTSRFDLSLRFLARLRASNKSKCVTNSNVFLFTL